MHDADTEKQSESAGRRGALAFAAALAGALMLAACGGAPEAPAPQPEAAPAAEPTPEPEPGPEPAAKADPEPAPEPVAAPAAGPKPAFATARDVWSAAPTLGSAVRAATRTSGTYGAAHSSEWQSVSASASPAGGGALRIAVGSPYSGLSFDSAGGAVFEVEPGVATTAQVVVNRDDDNASRWSTFGWWMALRGRDFIASAPTRPTVTGVEIGAFADGPEFRAAPVSLPLTGTATYRGPARGWYSAEIGSDGNAPGRRLAFGSGNPGSTLAGEFEGTASFEIRYDETSA